MGYMLTLFVKAFPDPYIRKGASKFTLTFAFLIFSEQTLPCFETLFDNYTLVYRRYFKTSFELIDHLAAK